MTDSQAKSIASLKKLKRAVRDSRKPPEPNLQLGPDAAAEAAAVSVTDIVKQELSSKFESNLEFSRRMLPQAQALLGRQLFSETSLHKDIKDGSDLILNFAGLEVAVRVRRHGRERFRGHLTLSTKKSASGESELSKILRGHVRYYFYGFANEREHIINWYIVDLDALRYHFALATMGAFLPRDHAVISAWGGMRSDALGHVADEEFMWIDLRLLPSNPKVILAKDAAWPYRAGE